MALALSNPFLHKNLSLPSPSLNATVKGVVGSNQMRWSCRKKDIHPEFHEDAKVYCNGELVMTTGGTKKEGELKSFLMGCLFLRDKNFSSLYTV
ncbi:hypothetical protein ACS0TY_026087 [Phlomoides rotata]